MVLHWVRIAEYMMVKLNMDIKIKINMNIMEHGEIKINRDVSSNSNSTASRTSRPSRPRPC